MGDISLASKYLVLCNVSDCCKFLCIDLFLFFSVSHVFFTRSLSFQVWYKTCQWIFSPIIITIHRIAAIILKLALCLMITATCISSMIGVHCLIKWPQPATIRMYDVFLKRQRVRQQRQQRPRRQQAVCIVSKPGWIHGEGGSHHNRARQ